jgi:hypothetical protein
MVGELIVTVCALANPHDKAMITIAILYFIIFSMLQKYTQYLLSGTPAFHDRAHVGGRSQLELQATNHLVSAKE